MRRIFVKAIALLLPGTAVAACASTPLSRQEILWLDRVTYGPTSSLVEEYLKLGRRRYLNEQLHPSVARLPEPAAALLAALEISHLDGAALLAAFSQEQQRINALPDETASGRLSSSAAMLSA
jgi:hypothetical protein